jgi:acyl-CoA synthetase (NDP forming)
LLNQVAQLWVPGPYLQHTGTLAGSDAAYNAAFRQSGVIRADSLEEMLDYSRAFSTYPLPRGRKVAILTNAGGLGIITADACHSIGLSITSFEEETIKKLREGAFRKQPVYIIQWMFWEMPAPSYMNMLLKCF